MAGDGERAPVVLDVGSYCLKAGFAGDDDPRAVIPTVVGTPRPGRGGGAAAAAAVGGVVAGGRQFAFGVQALMRRRDMSLLYPMQDGIPHDWDVLGDLLLDTVERELKVERGDSPILLTEPPSTFGRRGRELAMQALFETVGAPAAYLANTAPLSLYASGCTVGVAVDVGHAAAYSAAVFEGFVLPHTVSRLDLGGHHLTEYTNTLLNERFYSIPLH